MTDVNYQVSPPIQAFDQGHTNLCWLAASAVLFQWQQRTQITLQDAANRLGIEFITKYANGEALTYGDIPLWRTRGPFQSQGQQCLDVNGWVSLLTAHGPLITLVSGNATDTIDHALVVGGISGDGSPSGTNLTVADGNGGVLGPISLSTFVTMFEVT